MKETASEKPDRNAAIRVPRLFAQNPSVMALAENPPDAIAVAVSGGPDSMALLYLLSRMVGKTTTLHALTFDHGLRRESAKEAQLIGERVGDWPGVEHHILKWTGQKPATAIMEKARKARYARFHKWCVKHDVTQLWLGHHRTDQIETFLFRLAKGSGLDGLAVMRECQLYEKTGLYLIRPLLEISKDAIESFCRVKKIPHFKDPTNHNMDYARARLRHALPALEAEGLTEDRLAGTIRRIDRARQALDYYADKMIGQAALTGQDQSTIRMKALLEAPVEMRIRVIRNILDRMSPGGYGPRLDRLEELLDVFFSDIGQAKRFTLGGYMFLHDRKQDLFIILREKP